MEPPCDQLFPRTSELKLKRSRLSESRCCRCVTMFVHNKRGTASTESWKRNEAARKWEVEKLRVSQPGSHRFSLCACVAIVVYVLHSLFSSMAMKPVYDYKHTATSTTTTTTRISKVIKNSKKAFACGGNVLGIYVDVSAPPRWVIDSAIKFHYSGWLMEVFPSDKRAEEIEWKQKMWIGKLWKFGCVLSHSVGDKSARCRLPYK